LKPGGSVFVRTVFLLLVVALILAVNGCAKTSYFYGLPAASSTIPRAFTEGESQIERGEPYMLDSIASWTFGLFSKAILWNTKMDNHNISAETEQVLAVYLERNGLIDVKVRLNEYSPIDEWGRLFDNDGVGWGWRLTLGVISNLFYTFLPGRLLGGDNYNPYTNTVSLYSDLIPVALHEAGHVKDVMSRDWRGFYSAIGMLPLVSLTHEAEASGDAIGYFQDNKMRQEEVSAYKVLYPAFATYIGGEFAQFIIVQSGPAQLLFLIPVIPAHIIGRNKAGKVDVSDDPRLQGTKEAEETKAEDR
jgi:hypothetical protein